MSEYREALEQLYDASLPYVEKDPLIRYAIDRARALLAWPEPKGIPEADCSICVGTGSTRLFVHGSSEAISFLKARLSSESVEPAAADKARELLPSESIALTVALSQALRGAIVTPSVATVCVLGLARLAGKYDWTEESPPAATGDQP